MDSELWSSSVCMGRPQGRAPYLAAGNGGHRKGLCKGRAVQLADKLAQLGVRAAAEEHLAPLWCVLLAVLVCLRAFTFAIACPHPALNHFTFSMFFVDVFSVPPSLRPHLSQSPWLSLSLFSNLCQINLLLSCFPGI